MTGHELLILNLGFLNLLFAKLDILNICGYLLLDFFVVLDFSLFHLFRRLLWFRIFLLIYDLDKLLFGILSLCNSFKFIFFGQFDSLLSILFGMFLFLFLFFLLVSLPLFGRFFHFLFNFLLLFFLFDFILNKHFLEIYFGFFQLLNFFFFLLLCS